MSHSRFPASSVGLARWRKRIAAGWLPVCNLGPMANTFAVSRNHLIFGLCLPLAVLLGYLLAEPLESGSLAVMVMMVSVLFVPLMIRWHHLLLILSWNATVNPFFFPGRPALWMVLAFFSLFFGVLGRSVSIQHRFVQVPAVTRSLLCLLGVIVATALIRGGVGLRMLGTSSIGGKGYFFLLSAIVGYFALTSQPIPRHRAGLFVALFFLAGVTAAISNLIYVLPTGFYFLYELFPPSLAMDQAMAEGLAGENLVRITGLVSTSQALYGFLLSRYGIRGVFDFTRPWRTVFFLGAVMISLFGGYRSSLVLFCLTFVVLFFVEGLWRTRFVFVIACVALVVGGVFATYVDRMPLSVQRTLSFLPLKVDPQMKQAAESTTHWRLDLWQEVLPQVPKYLFLGKGFALNPDDLFLIQESARRGYVKTFEMAAMAGDYHNGPLSVLIPFGLPGAAAFLWFLGAGIRTLFRNHRHGDPALRQVNAFLLALFVTRVIFFFGLYGALSTELFYFTGLVGLSVALNGGEARPGGNLEPAED